MTTTRRSYDDTIVIDTPEGVQLELTLAGLGSRGTSEMADTIIKVVLGLLAALLFLFGSGGAAAAFVIWFLLVFGYDILFETKYDGRSPGNKMNGIRVISEDGGPVTFTQSAIRTFMRLVDFLPSFYLLASVVMLRSSRNQRLGDMAAGTLVVRERFGDDVDRSRRAARRTAPDPDTAGIGVAAPDWNVTAVTPDELRAIRQFLERRGTLPLPARNRISGQLANHLRPKIAGTPANVGDEALLEGIAAAKAARG